MSGLHDAASAREYGAALLRGENVYLRELHDDDLPLLTKWWNDPQVSAPQTLVVQPQPEASVVERYRTWSANKGASANPGGDACRRRRAEHWSRGLGTDALRVMVRYGFEELGLNRIGLGVWAYNDRAIAAYRKVGFVEEGRRRQMAFHAGQFHDEVLMGLLRSEWERLPS